MLERFSNLSDSSRLFVGATTLFRTDSALASSPSLISAEACSGTESDSVFGEKEATLAMEESVEGAATSGASSPFSTSGRPSRLTVKDDCEVALFSVRGMLERFSNLSDSSRLFVGVTTLFRIDSALASSPPLISVEAFSGTESDSVFGEKAAALATTESAERAATSGASSPFSTWVRPSSLRVRED